MQNRKQNNQRAAIRVACAARGITIEQLGESYVVRGLGVDLRTSDLANLDPDDLKPYQPRERMQADNFSSKR